MTHVHKVEMGPAHGAISGGWLSRWVMVPWLGPGCGGMIQDSRGHQTFAAYRSDYPRCAVQPDHVERYAWGHSPSSGLPSTKRVTDGGSSSQGTLCAWLGAHGPWILGLYPACVSLCLHFEDDFLAGFTFYFHLFNLQHAPLAFVYLPLTFCPFIPYYFVFPVMYFSFLYFLNMILNFISKITF